MSEQERKSAARVRFPHAVLDEPSRVLKAKKIIDLLGEEQFGRALSILEIGCGSGVISSTLAKLGSADLEVTAVDVTDNRIVTDGYAFRRVEGTSLPFDDGAFDIVISNHVIEHVGNRADQLHHLEEISRVMKLTGCVYLAVPNKWRLIEPHYRLPLLSWIPAPLADSYVRATSRGSHYDCVPLSMSQAQVLFAEAGFRFNELTVEAVRSTLRIEFPRSSLAQALAAKIPAFLIAFTKPFVSTLIFRLERIAS